MGEKSGDAKTFWMKLEDDGKIDFIFEQVQNVLRSLKQKIKDGSATSKEYIQAMILVKEATIGNSSTLKKDYISVAQNVQEDIASSLPSTSCKDSFPEERVFISTKSKEVPPLEYKVANFEGKESSVKLSYQSHDCAATCLIKIPVTFKEENPLQLPIKYHFQRRHAKTNSHSLALHVSYKTPCGKSLRNMEEVFRYLLETECNFLFTDNFSFNTYVQLTRNYPKQEEIVSDVDISNGVESVPISFCNEVDNRKLPQFKYRKTMWPRSYYLNSFSNMFNDSCDCSEGCVDITKCACLQMTLRNAEDCPLSNNEITTGYKYKRLQRHVPSGIYECSLLCKCNRQMCQNRVVQHGPQLRLQVFKTEKKGWGVRCLDDIDRGTFVCIYSGRLLSRSNTEKPDAIDKNGTEENIMEKTVSKKRKIEVADCEVEVISLGLETQQRDTKIEESVHKFNSTPKEMKYKPISGVQYHSVIRSSKAKTTDMQRNGEKMEFCSSDSVPSEDYDGFKPVQVYLNPRAKEMKKCSLVDTNSNQVENCEASLLIESNVIDITKCREETPPRSRCNSQATLSNQNIEKEFEIQVQSLQDEKSPVCQNQQAFCDEELFSKNKNNSSDSPEKFSKENVFLLDARKEGNVGRFLNHSCCPNLLVQNVFVETHDRKFPLVAFFTNRYVKARTELTWDYGYEAGTVPEKEILCQCVFQVTEKMVKKTCAFCPKGLDCGILYFAQSENVVAHENCLLYSSALVECDDRAEPSSTDDRNFDVKSVQKEISRGRKLRCSSCGMKGATVGCDVPVCPRSYHYFCAKKACAVLQCDRYRGIYNILCPTHAPEDTQNESAEPSSDSFHLHRSQKTEPRRHGVRKRGRRKTFLPDTHIWQFATANRCSKKLEEGRHAGTTVKADFLKKCKKAGLLDVLFEEILDKLHLTQKRLMDETASDSDYEEIWTSIFEYRLFEDTFANLQAAINNKIHQSKERQQQLEEEIELLQDIQHSLSSIKGNS
ncbi:histone-lysine N-methyltransferase SETDB2 [Erinaceus europaeus]|uniref:Histone-lysine N-methyltransferase SETDB2 n=1 Tax=Erinaceus europaeus TaxID=9365 RepID=A0ABM3XPW0_ERIEU|nr:histone-lysine N-methyltransferase SETDB2 [Erinaceus europaeus]